MNAVANSVGKDYPNITISTLAYLDTSAPPKHIRPHKNVAIELCTDSHAWSEPFLTVEETQQFQSRMKQWAAIGANIDIWDYTVNFSNFPAPMPNWQVVADDIRFFVAHNAKGVMMRATICLPEAPTSLCAVGVGEAVVGSEPRYPIAHEGFCFRLLQRIGSTDLGLPDAALERVGKHATGS